MAGIITIVDTITGTTIVILTMEATGVLPEVLTIGMIGTIQIMMTGFMYQKPDTTIDTKCSSAYLALR